MKKIILTLIVSLFVFVCFAADPWSEYYDLKYKAKNSKDFIEASEYYAQAADVVGKLNRKDIQVWQLNNAGYALIQEFMRVTDYENTMEALIEDKSKLAETKALLIKNIELLDKAKTYLEAALALDPNEEQLVKIQSNLTYINWVENYLR